jgi:uncharacterized protein YjbI with pentapeptide repeats
MSEWAGWLDANLTDAYLNRSNLSHADLVGANLTDANLDGQTQLDQACGTPAKLPEGLHPPKPCPPPPALR